MTHFALIPLVAQFEEGLQLEVCWQKFDDLSITWNTIDVTRPATCTRPASATDLPRSASTHAPTATPPLLQLAGQNFTDGP